MLPFWSLNDRSDAIQSWKDKLAAHTQTIVVASPMIVHSLQRIDTPFDIRFVTSVSSEVSDWNDTLLVVLASDVWMDTWLLHHLDTTDLSKGTIVYCIEDEVGASKDVAIAALVGTHLRRGCWTRDLCPILLLHWLYRQMSNLPWRNQTWVTATSHDDLGTHPLCSQSWRVDLIFNHMRHFCGRSTCCKELHSLSDLTGRMESRRRQSHQSRLVLSQTVQVGEGIFNMLSANPSLSSFYA